MHFFPTPLTLHAGGCAANVTKLLPCGINSCYVALPSVFDEGCKRIGGAVVKTGQGVPMCFVKGEASQIQPCGGKSCYITRNFTEGCESIGGFISGNLNQPPAGAICSLGGVATQFGPCPSSSGTCTIEKGFEDTCTGTLKGFIDGYSGPPPGG